MDMKRLQQGDVNLFLVDEMPKGLKRMKARKRGYVLAEGETTGHAHTIEETRGVELFGADDGTLWLMVKDKPVILRHEEHKHITVPAGKYRVGIVREVDPFAEEIKKVTD